VLKPGEEGNPGERKGGKTRELPRSKEETICYDRKREKERVPNSPAGIGGSAFHHKNLNGKGGKKSGGGKVGTIFSQREKILDRVFLTEAWW